MVPHSILNELDTCDRNSEAVRRMLANLDHDERKRHVGEWLVEAVDDAIGGTARQRERAGAKLTNREYVEMARAWAKRQREKAEACK